MARPEKLKIRPYARLLTMLGEQLIRNERIALIELIKNAYDADSPWVKISFLHFKDDFEITPRSKIVIEDAGHGMNDEIIRKHWLNPATPEKMLRKMKKETTSKGRVIQGEKGIGRFAVLKLGRKVDITTRAKGEADEHLVNFDFSQYDDEFLKHKGQAKELFIDDLSVSLTTRDPEAIIDEDVHVGLRKRRRPPHGTRIEISHLKGSWSEKKIAMIYRDITRLQSIFTDITDAPIKRRKKDSFDVWIYRDEEPQKYKERYFEKLRELLQEHSVIRVTDGFYNEDKGKFEFILNETPQVLSLRDPAITGLKVFKDRFGPGGKMLDTRRTECGSFRFGFFVFDLSSKAPAKFALDKEDKQTVRDHRIYLYRDDIRVYPYGEPDDDWLRIDMWRGTIAAGHFLSNDQVVGHVNITHKDNIYLKDKTNREGLIEQGNATEDLIVLLQTFLAYLRHKPYARYRADLQNKNVQDIFRTEQVQDSFDRLKKAVEGNKKASNLLSKAEKEYHTERQYLVQRAETTEDLAAVGLSVETASHDIMAIMHKAMINIDCLIREAMHSDLDQDTLQEELQSLRGMLSFIESQLTDIQLLFKSSKQRRRPIKVRDILDKVVRIYTRLIKKDSIKMNIHSAGSPLKAKTTDAVLLQLFLNLFDNAIYWLQQTSISEKKIEIRLDGAKGQILFSDNGPGVSKDDAPYIFEPFYSGKGEEGRGLGLYIAKQLLERNDYSIELAELKADKLLPGANFVVSFVAKE